MSRKQMLTKKVAHTLLAMSIVSASGLNLWAGTAWAAADGNNGADDTRENVSISDSADISVAGGNGTDGVAGSGTDDAGGNGGKGGSAALSGTLTVNDSSKAVSVTVKGGNGGNGGAQSAQTNAITGNGGSGGEAELQLTVGSDVQTGALTLEAEAGNGGNGGNETNSASATNVTVGNGGAGGNAAAGIAITDGSLTATSISLTIKAGDAGAMGNIKSQGRVDNHGGDGGTAGTAVVRGLVLSGQQAAVKVANNIVITGTGGNGGTGGSVYGEAGLAAVGGAAEAYGLVAADNGAYAVQFTDLTLQATGGDGGNGGSADLFFGSSTNNSQGDPYLSTDGADGGNAVGKGLLVESGDVQLTADNITSTVAGGNGGNAGNNNKATREGAAAGQGGMASATGIAVTGGLADKLSIKVIKAAATGGKGGTGALGRFDDRYAGTDAEQGSVGGAGGEAYAYGLFSSSSTKITADSITVEAAGGSGGQGGKGGDNNSFKGRNGGSGSNAYAYGIWGSSVAEVTAGSISSTATGGKGGNGGSGSADGIGSSLVGSGGSGGTGGNAFAYGVYGSGSTIIATDSISVEVAGGAGGDGDAAGSGVSGTFGESATSSNIGTVGGIGSNGGDGGSGGTGGLATAYGLHSSGGITVLTAESINVQATGGAGGTGGQGGQGGNGGLGGGGNGAFAGSGGDLGGGYDGGDGGDGGTGGTGGTGGSAVAYGLHSSGGITILTADSITAQASGGTMGSGGIAGSGGSGGSGGYGSGGASNGQKGVQGASGTAGADGQKGAQAEAYGVYADNGAVITLSAKTDSGTPSGTITIGAKADNATRTEAYAVYADNATVLFNDNAVLNTSDGSSTDNTVITYLNNATLGFGSPAAGQNVGRTINGGTLRLAGSNTFKVAADLSNVTPNADKFTFAKLAADSSTATQYITVGYDKAFDGSSLDSFIGEVTVLTVTDLAHGQNLNNFIGKESVMDDPLTRFLATPTVTVDGNDVKITQIDFEEAGASETVMTAADAQMALGSMWRIEGNNLMKRMGELRSDKEAAKGGVWARYYRGELSADSDYDRSFSQDYTAFQGGIDKVQDYKGGKLYTGIAVNRIDSNAGYTAGSGDLSSTGVGVYASWLGSKGHYLDVIARGSKLTNDFKFVDSSNNAAKADYDTWAYGISTEYGYRQNLNAGWFVEPQAELSLGHIGSVDYTTSNEVSVKQDSVDSAVTRVGILGGKEFTIGGRPSNAYVKASLLHDFGGNGGATGYYGNDSLALQTGDLTGTWYEIGLGANLGIAKNSNLYFDALKTFGGDLRTDWQFNAGLRFTF